jgi:hypothetical protein
MENTDVQGETSCSVHETQGRGRSPVPVLLINTLEEAWVERAAPF